MHRDVGLFLLFLFFVLLWNALIVSAPWLAGHGYEQAASVNYFLFKDVCHQRPERSFFLGDFQFGVCARDTGIYLGFLLSTMAYPAYRRLGAIKTPSKWLLVAAVAPLAIDGTVQLVTGYESTNARRLVTGLLAGVVTPLYVIPVYYQLVDVASQAVSERKATRS